MTAEKTSPDWFFPKGSLASGGWESVVDPTIPGWRHTGLRVGTLRTGVPLSLAAGDVERLVVPLAGSLRVDWVDAEGTGHSQELEGRPSVFSGASDVLYLGAGTSVTLVGEGRVAVAEAPDAEPRASRYIPRSEVAVEVRGAGQTTREVHNIGTPATLDASRFMVVEVITPSMNWSSFPPHKHDEDIAGKEAALEEIYYFEAAAATPDAPDAADAYGVMRAYSSDDRHIEVMQDVRTGDIVLAPYGYHGPTVAVPGYDLYFLNVMAGPAGGREWLLSLDEAHGWVVAGFEGQAPDPRLPFGKR